MKKENDELKKKNDKLKKQNDTLKVKGAEKSDSWIGRTNSNDTNETVPDYVPGSDIVKRMKKHPFNSKIQRTGLEGLRDLVKNYPVALADQGGVHAVVTAMKNLPNDASVQKEGSRVLYYFSLNKQECRRSHCTGGGWNGGSPCCVVYISNGKESSRSSPEGER